MSDSIMVLSKSSSQKFSLDLLKLGSLVWLFAIAAIAKDISPFKVDRDFSSFRRLKAIKSSFLSRTIILLKKYFSLFKSKFANPKETNSLIETKFLNKEATPLLL